MRTGGGTRTLNLPKKANKDDIIREGKELFREGILRRANEDDFVYEVLDYAECRMPDDLTVSDVYQNTKLAGCIRFYLATRRIGHDPADTVNSEETEDGDLDDNGTITFRVPEQEFSDPEQPHPDDPEPEFPEIDDDNEGPEMPEMELPDLDLPDFELPDMELPELELRGVQLPEREVHQLRGLETPVEYNVTRNPVLNINDDDDGVAFTNSVSVHRINIVEDMARAFMAPDMADAVITLNFVGEDGADASGVSRDAYTCFWKCFMNSEADGENMLVPAVNTKWQPDEWVSVGRILAKGYNDHNFLPLKLTMAFMIALIHGEAAVTPTVLSQGLLSYLCTDDAALVRTALDHPETLDDDQRELLVDVFDGLGCCQLPSDSNAMGACILQTAQAKLIQEPKYVLDCMAEGCRPTLRTFFRDAESVEAIYEEMKVTTKRVSDLLTANPSSQSEGKAFRFLQQYVRSQNPEALAKLLHFLTGTDVMCVSKIDVEFTQTGGLGRRPIAHTCGPLLQLPATYSAYRELRQEFDGILQGDSGFTMGIV